MEIRFYEVNYGNNLTNVEAPCVLKLRNFGTYHWYNGWGPPDDHNILPKELGEYIEEKHNELLS